MRQLILFGLGLVLSVSSIFVYAQSDAEPLTLRELADENGIFIGAAVQSGLLENEPDYANTVSREFNLITTEWETKMCVTQPTPDTFDFEGTDAMLEFAEANDMALRGHTLLWHQCFPEWLENGDYSREEAIEILKNYIDTVVGRYKGRIAIWDVVNEGVDDSGRMRQTQWKSLIGDDYIELAFRFAHEADPDAMLFYNDYSTETMNRKSDSVYELVSALLENDVPIDGVGLQMHIMVGDARPNRSIDPDELRENIERLGELGLQVQITEMDVRHSGLPTASILERQAEDYRQVVEVCLQTEACNAIIFWGFTDLHSWIPEFFGNADAAPLLFDRNYQPKPAYEEVQQALQNALTAES